MWLSPAGQVAPDISNDPAQRSDFLPYQNDITSQKIRIFS